MKLDPKEHIWLNAASSMRVFDALGVDNARFVGGCVRNAILGAPVSDLDVATVLSPDEVIKALKAHKISVHETGIAHGTVTAIADQTVFEITTLRQDVSTDGRRATVAFTTDWVEDSLRRDFTINALYARPDGTVFDPTHEGLADIKACKIRFVGDADTRIKEDYLRVLRFFRFNAVYNADGKMDADGLKACKDNQAGIGGLSAERVWSEIKKILGADKPARVVNSMFLGGILERLLPEASNNEGLQLVCALESETSIEPDLYLRLMSMAARDEMAMMRLAKRLKLSSNEKSRVLAWASDRTSFDPKLEGNDLKSAVFTAGRQVSMDRACIRAAGCEGAARIGWLHMYTFAKDWTWPKFPVTGKDLKRAGIKEGEAMGKTLNALKALWIRSGFTANKQQLLTALILLGRGNLT